MTIEIKQKIQADYNQITDFSQNWVANLAKKYEITEDEVWDCINL